MNKDHYYMKRALALAERGRGRTYPNPLVGAVVVKKGRVIGKGFHSYYGGPHAEAVALSAAGRKSIGATLYVTLEPCSTYGKTPPCTREIVKSGIRRVVIAVLDPNPRHHGKGKMFLKKNRISVRVGIEKKAAIEQNTSFFKYHRTALPYIHLKMAQSLDGKIASRTGDSKWISSKEARRLSHRLRAEAQAVLVGEKTALLDDPRLSVRNQNRSRSKQPIRIVIDPQLRLPLRLRLYNVTKQSTLVITKSSNKGSARWRALERRGVRLLPVSNRKKYIDLKKTMRDLARRGVINVLVEGGGETAARFLEERLVDKMSFFVALKIIGGRSAKTSVEGEGVKYVRNALTLRDIIIKNVGNDICFEGVPNYS